MTPEELLKTLLESRHAKITAECDENGNSTVAVESRKIDIIVLSLSIIKEIIKENNGVLTVDKYCEMLKYTFSKPKEQIDVEKEIMKKIFESVFK